MKIISTIKEFRKWRNNLSGSVGFVPTMGAIHDGHLSLIEKSIFSCCNTIVSIYLNPLQFAVNEDLDNYPQNIENDIKILSNYSVQCIFIPSISEIYPQDFSVTIKSGSLANVLEGKSRPSFFSGVTTIVCKLFNIISPSHAFFGEKDAQQLRIIKQLVRDLNFPIQIISCPIIREKNGLAMSSRNQYLSIEKQEIASIIFKSLQLGKKLLINGERTVNVIKNKIINNIKLEPLLTIDYVSIADSKTLKEVEFEIEDEILVSVAIFFDKIRLIDNFTFKI